MLLRLFDRLIIDLTKACRNLYGAELVSLVVFGSVGRKTPNPNSDVDFLVVAKNLPSGRLNRMDQFTQVENELEETLENLRQQGIDTELSPIIKTPQEVELGSLIFLDMLNDADILHDHNDYFLQYLNRLRSRLHELGAYRVDTGSSWHWVLKKHYKHGEVFEL